MRRNENGILKVYNYGMVSSIALDPIEKKPLHNFKPGSSVLSFGSVGCNFRCVFCQNYEISQLPQETGQILGVEKSVSEIVEKAKRYECKSISYTYTEPTIFFELAYDVAKLATSYGIKNNFVTNGFMTPETIKMISPYLDAANVDLKSFRDDFYKTYTKAKLQPVLDSIKLMKELGIWVEVTTLIIPGLNDSDAELKDIANFIAKDVGIDVPWHISRFYPQYKMLDRPPTPVKTLYRAYEIGKEAGLKYVYTGNVFGDPYSHTYCPSCGKIVIERYGFSVSNYKIENGKCSFCKAEIDGVGM